MKYIIYILILLVVIVGGYLAFTNTKSDLQLSKLFPAFSNSSSTGGFKLNLGFSNPALDEVQNARKEAHQNEVIPSPREPEKPVIVPPTGFSLSQLSPYYDKVRLESVTRAYDDYYSQSQFTLRTDYSLENGVNVTGWKIKGNKGAEIVIPRAIGDYGVQGFSQASDILLKKGDYLTVYSGKSPSNQNFRLNKCIGYLNNLYTFSPSLPNNCPSIDRNKIISFSGRCQSFIYSLGTCEEPSSNERNQFTTPEDASCGSFLTALNYGGCYSAHRYETDFFSNEWRAWVNQQFSFDRDHDRVLLYDRNGLLVDEYTY